MDMKSFHIGMMRSNARFDQSIPIPSPTGGAFDDYAPYLTTRCYLRKKSGYRNIEGSEIVITGDYEMVVRFQTLLEQSINNNLSLRVVCNNKIFTIISIELYEESKNNFYILQLAEGQQG